MSDTAGNVAYSKSETGAGLPEYLAAWHDFLRRNPLTADMLTMLPEREQEIVQTYWLAGYSQGRVDAGRSATAKLASILGGVER